MRALQPQAEKTMPIDIELPECVSRYLREENTDAGALEHCFAADAQVRDEGRVLRGRKAIGEWKRDAKARYRYSIEPLSARRDGDRIMVRVLTTGDFPGSPLKMDYDIAVADGLIATLEIR